MVHARLGVGQNLSDHYAALIVHRLRDLVSVNQLARRRASDARRGALSDQYKRRLYVRREGGHVFAKSREGPRTRSLQLSFTHMSRAPDRHNYDSLEREPGASIAVCVAQPDINSSVLARSANPTQYPAIRPNYMSAQWERGAATSRDCGSRIRSFAASSWTAHSKGEVRPGPKATTDVELADYARASAEPAFSIPWAPAG